MCAKGIVSRSSHILVLALLAAGITLGPIACAPTPGLDRARVEAALDLPYPPRETPASGTILHTRTGRPLDTDELIDLLSSYRVIYLAESHDNLAVHRFQGQVLDALAKRRPGRVVVGMEMFQHDAQPQLDRWHRGELPPDELAALWKSNWGFDMAIYQPVFDTIERHRLPVIGLRVPRGGGRPAPAAAHHAMDDAQGTDDPYQRRLLEAVFAGHGMGERGMDHFIAIQRMWDEAMAARAARFLESEAGQDATLVILAGGYHVEYGIGIPRRLFHRVPLPYVTVLPRLARGAEVPEQSQMEVDLPFLPLVPGDIHVYLDYEVLPDP